MLFHHLLSGCCVSQLSGYVVLRPIVSFHFLFPSVYGRATRIDTDLRAKKSAIPKELPIKKSSTIILVTSVNIIKFKLHIIPIICIFFHLHPLASAGNLRVARNTFCETKKYIMKRNAICKKWNVPKALPCNAFRSHVNPALTVIFLKTARAATSKDSESDVANNHRGFESHPLCHAGVRASST